MPTAEKTAVQLQRVLAVAALALVASTWRLWTPGTEFPQVPWFAWARGIPWFVDWGAITGLLTGCLLLLSTGGTSALRRGGGWLLAGSLVVLFLPSQQRFQPWAYQFLLVSLILSLSPRMHGVRLLQWLVASIYFHSALSKVDAAFFDAQGEMLLRGLLESLRLGGGFQTDGATRFAIGLFPAAELAIGFGLLVPTVRRWALIASFALHVLLLLALGPLGLNHKPGVLIWNAYFMAQNWILFRPATALEGAADPAGPGNSLQAPVWRRRFATVIAVAAIIGPFLHHGNWFDAWPSWAVYSSRASHVTMQVRDDRVADLPDGLREFVGARAPLSDWRPVNLDSWSFATLNCPMYPDRRFRIGVIRALAENCELAGDVRAVVYDPPDRWTGARRATEVNGSAALATYSAGFWLNTAARGR